MNGADVFDADLLRLLRGVRIAAELGFELELVTEAAIRERASRVTEAAAERRRDVLARISRWTGGTRVCDCSTASGCWTYCCQSWPRARAT